MFIINNFRKIFKLKCLYIFIMNLDKDFENIITTIDNLKHKINNQEYLNIMKSLKNIFNKKDVVKKQVICNHCLTNMEGSDDYDSTYSDNDMI